MSSIKEDKSNDSDSDSDKGQHNEVISDKPKKEAESDASETDDDEDVKNTTKKVPDDEFVDILGNGKLLKKVLRKGQHDSRPPSGFSVVISYTAYLASTNEQVEKVDKLKYTLGDGDVLQVFDLAVALMDVYEIASVRADARYAYKVAGKPPLIPPNTTLLFTITLLEAHPLETLIDDIAAILATVTNKKLRGNEHFLRQEFEESVHCYSKGIKLLEKIDERQKEVTETLNKLDLASEEGQYAQPLLQAKLLTPEQKSSILALHIDLLNNIASAQLKLELPHKTLETSEKVLKLSPNNPKALLRNVQGHRMLNNIDEGVAILKEAFKNDPSLKTISNLREEYSLFIKLQAESDKKDRKLYQKMVASLGDNNNNNNNSSSSSSTNDLWSNWEQTKWRNPQFLLLWVVIITGVVIASWIRWSGILDFPSESSSSLPSSLPSSEAAAAAATAKAVLLEGDYEEF